MTPRLQRVLDALDPTPAIIRTATWDVVAWNRGATVLLIDFAAAEPKDRNLLRAMFLDPRMRRAQHDWQAVARYVVGAFRVESARAGAAEEVRPLIEELSALSPEFRDLWRKGDLLSAHGEMVKHLRHPVLGEIAFEHSSFAVDGRPDLSLLIYNPTNEADARKIAEAVAD